MHKHTCPTEVEQCNDFHKKKMQLEYSKEIKLERIRTERIIAVEKTNQSIQLAEMAKHLRAAGLSNALPLYTGDLKRKTIRMITDSADVFEAGSGQKKDKMKKSNKRVKITEIDDETEDEDSDDEEDDDPSEDESDGEDEEETKDDEDDSDDADEEDESPQKRKRIDKITKKKAKACPKKKIAKKNKKSKA